MEHNWKKYKHLGERCQQCAKERSPETEHTECEVVRLELIRPIRPSEEV